MAPLTPATARQQGMSRSTLHRAARDGKLERIARGIYLPADANTADWEWIEAASRRPEATICLTSALALHDLTDEIPATLNVAIHPGSTHPSWHLGNQLAPLPHGNLRSGSRRGPHPRH